MKKHLEQLPHQEDAIKAIMDAMQGCRDIDNNTDVYANPNISVKSGIDVKMETGTGKTYVYIRMMFEMFQKYGINKFIIFVPSLAIKEGTKSFIMADYSRQHFSELYENIQGKSMARTQATHVLESLSLRASVVMRGSPVYFSMRFGVISI